MDKTQKIGLVLFCIYLVLTVALIVKYPIAVIFVPAIIVYELNN